MAALGWTTVILTVFVFVEIAEAVHDRWHHR